MNKLSFYIISLCLLLASCGQGEESNNKYVNKFIGTGLEGRINPVASVPFGMVQIGADTRSFNSGYHYDETSILGFSHLHKSGGGCGDFLDILFMPLSPEKDVTEIEKLLSKYYQSTFSHQQESAEPGYYTVDLYDNTLKVELTASDRCGLQKYNYNKAGTRAVLIDLKYGSEGACTIQPQHDVDTVYISYIEQVDEYSVRGYRISNGWAPEQHVYFHTVFSQPIKDFNLYVDDFKVEGKNKAEGRNLKVIVSFADEEESIEVKTGISAVDMDGAFKNYEAEVLSKNFAEVKQEASKKWSGILNTINIETSDEKKKEIFYTSLHNVMMYPMLYSDVDFRYRGSDKEVHKANGYNYYGAVVGLWDTFRAACPLTAMLYPEVMTDYVKTALEHYKHCGQLPIWTLAGQETYQMIGIHAMPMITNAYMNGVTDFDTNLAMAAMVASAMKDTCGYSMGYFVGLENYKKYGYVPADIEMESVARTLEYAYDDYAIAKFAELVGHKDDVKYFGERANNYKNVIDPTTLLARGRMKDGSWRTPFNPLSSEHRKDDYCEGNAWQWTFFAPHDVDGLASLMGGSNVLEARLDSLFTMSSDLHGEDVSGDISGLIGQYAHGNEPGHHTIYMYNKLNKPKKTQKYIHEVLTTLYNNTPDGICGNEDTGQMSAWYVYSALGFYPMDPVSGKYELGTPLFEKASIKLPNSKIFVVKAENVSDTNIYYEEVFLNGKLLDRTYITFDEVLDGGELVFRMKNN